MAPKKPARAIPVVTPQERLQAQAEWALSTEQGRAWHWHLLDEVCQLNGQTFAGESSHTTAFHAGRRQVGIELMQLLQRFAPHLYRQMLDEALHRSERARPVAPVRHPAD
jgi:hypothetical protein